MRYFIVSLLSIFAVFSLIAQTGPGGVGTSTNNLIWLDANRLGLTNGASVSSFTDFSGNSNDADQSTGGNQPTFRTSELNSLPAVEFDGTDDYLEFITDITTQAQSHFIVYEKDVSAQAAPFTLNRYILYHKNSEHFTFSESPVLKHKVTKNTGSYTICTSRTSGSASGVNLEITSGPSNQTRTRNTLQTYSNSVLGARATGASSVDNYLDGKIAEFIIYNEELSSAERDIISSYLAAKYSLTPMNNYFSYGAAHGNEVMGIGQESDGSNTSAQGTDSLLMDNPSTLGDGDYLLVGNDGGGFGVSASVPSGIVERWTRVWRADVTGTPGTVDVEFFLGASGFSAVDNYVVLVETDDGDFTNGNTSTHETGRSFNLGNLSISFTGLSLSDGDYFTLAEKSSSITTVQDGDWDDNDTWNCACEPGATDVVTIENTVTVTANANVLNIDFQGGGLDFSGTDTLFVAGDITTDAAITITSGTIVTNGTSAQTFTNSSGSPFSFNNLSVTNTSTGLILSTGGWEITNSLRVSSGGLNVSSADSVVIVSNPTKTAEVLESMSNAFTGDFIVQRYIGARNANYSNFSSPISNATVADLDDDLFLSGVKGNDGNATVGGGGIFYSIYIFDIGTDLHDSVVSTTTALKNGIGYEVYLATILGSFSATTVDYRGTLNNGDISGFDIRINSGWNLLGNPYQSFLSWDDVTTHSSVSKDYYIFDTDAGSYTLFAGSSGNSIAPAQGFWVFKFTGGARFHTYEESNKLTSTSSTFIRRKSNPWFSMKISSEMNPFSHKLNVQFKPDAIAGIDQTDAYYLPSPIKEAPAIYSKAINSNEGLALNSLNSFDETQVIPIEVYTGVDGEYNIDANEMDNLYNHYDCVYLKDKESSKAIDLSFKDQYTFESKKGTHDRFELILSNNYNECEKLLKGNNDYLQNLDPALDLRNSNGLWYLDYTLDATMTQVEINVYNTAGQLVKETVSFSASNAGTFQLNQLQDLSGVYLIQVRTTDKILNKTIQL